MGLERENDKDLQKNPEEHPASPAMFFQFENQKHFPAILVSITVITFFWYQAITWTQYASGRIFFIDAGMMDFVCSGFRHGHFLRQPINWSADVSIFADHYRLTFIFIALLYFIVDHCMTMLTVFNASLVFAAIPLAYLARRITRHEGISLLVVLIFLTNIFVRSIHLSAHPESMVLLGFFLFFWGVEKRSWPLMIAGVFWAFGAKEDIPLYFGAYSLVLIFSKDLWMRKVGITFLLVSIAGFILAIATMKFAGMDTLISSGFDPLIKYSDMGSNKSEVLIHMVTHPVETAGKILRKPLLFLFLSMGLLPILDWKRAWLIIFAASVFMIVDSPTTGNLEYYYSYAAVPFVFLSGLHGIAIIQRWMATKSSIPAHFQNRGILIFITIILMISFPMKTKTDQYPHQLFEITDRDRFIAEVADSIPEDASVAAQYTLYTRTPNRPIKLPVALEHLQYVDYVFLDDRGFHDRTKEELLEVGKILNSDEFEIEFDVDGLVIFKRVNPPK